MRIALVFLLVVLAMLIAGLYGALYDQITYSVSSEFFTMRFSREGISAGASVRWEVAKMGFINTWSVGLGLGVFLSLTGLLHADNKKMFYTTLQTFFITLGTGFLLGMLALLLADSTENVASEITDKKAFSKVLSMNNYSYVGGVIGMFLGVGWHILKTRLNRKKIT